MPRLKATPPPRKGRNRGAAARRKGWRLQGKQERLARWLILGIPLEPQKQPHRHLHLLCRAQEMVGRQAAGPLNQSGTLKVQQSFHRTGCLSQQVPAPWEGDVRVRTTRTTETGHPRKGRKSRPRVSSPGSQRGREKSPSPAVPEGERRSERHGTAPHTNPPNRFCCLLCSQQISPFQATATENLKDWQQGSSWIPRPEARSPGSPLQGAGLPKQHCLFSPGIHHKHTSGLGKHPKGCRSLRQAG